jgi:hypothetical protein
MEGKQLYLIERELWNVLAGSSARLLFFHLLTECARNFRMFSACENLPEPLLHG